MAIFTDDFSSSAASPYELEAVLDSNIQCSHALAPSAAKPRSIFLTGATGLLGAYLLEELLQKTEAVAHCLVRATDPIAGRRRIVRNLESMGLWQENFEARIIPVLGDAGLPRFGLNEEQFDALAVQTDAILYSAGSINMMHSYARLRSTNVLGVQEGLRLACRLQTKPFHYISSIAVFFSQAHPADQILMESENPKFHSNLKGGYAISKWAADGLVRCAQQRGLPVCIYRPTRIMGHSRTGALNHTAELLPQLLKGCVLMGQYPSWDIEVTWVPVDYISEAILYLLAHPKSWGKAFHFFNPFPIRWKALWDLLRECGYALEEASEAQWQQNLRDHILRHTDAFGDKNFFPRLWTALKAPHFLFHQRPPFNNRNLEEALAGTGIACPPIDRTLISRYVAYWRQSGFLPPPGNK